MSTHRWTPREMERAADAFVRILDAAHRRMDQLGYPPATPHYRNEELSCGLWMDPPESGP